MFVRGGIVHDHAHITSMEKIQAKIEEVCVKFTQIYFILLLIYCQIMPYLFCAQKQLYRVLQRGTEDVVSFSPNI